jgi:flagellar motor switch/type III secretory pathway protein FliN
MGTMNEKQLPAESGSNPLDPPVPPAANWRQFGWLPCNLSLELPVAHFTVRELLRLAPSRIVPTQWSCGTEVPLRANGQLIGWAEFEPVGDHIGARITELM